MIDFEKEGKKLADVENAIYLLALYVGNMNNFEYGGKFNLMAHALREDIKSKRNELQRKQAVQRLCERNSK